MILDGKVVAQSFKNEIKNEVQELSKKKIIPVLAVVQLCDEESLEIYLKTRVKIGNELGIEVKAFKLQNPTFLEVKRLISKLNHSKKVWGIMIDRPIPKTLNEDEIIDLIDPKKDVEGCTFRNGGKLLFGAKTVTAPTAAAAHEILKFYNIPIQGKNCVIVGRSKAVGTPLFHLLEKDNGTCTLCHSKTQNLEEITSKADILVVAIGKKEFITEKYLNKKSTIIDVGTHYDENGKICGDIDRSAYEKVENYSPSPGGVGPVTNIMLFINLLRLRGLL